VQPLIFEKQPQIQSGLKRFCKEAAFSERVLSQRRESCKALHDFNAAITAMPKFAMTYRMRGSDRIKAGNGALAAAIFIELAR
jgi:hypothetical protein